jgi:hypothetical protein
MPETIITRKLNAASNSVGPLETTGAGTGDETAGPGEGGGEGILGMSAVCNLTVGLATAVDADDGEGMAAGEAAVAGGAGAAATVDGICPTGWARTVGGGTTGAATLVAPGTLPVVFFNRDVSFFGTIGMAATVEPSFAPPVVPSFDGPAVPAGAVPAADGGTGRGGNVMRTVSFFSCLAASPVEGVSAIITSQFRRSITTVQDLSKIFSRWNDARAHCKSAVDISARLGKVRLVSNNTFELGGFSS